MPQIESSTIITQYPYQVISESKSLNLANKGHFFFPFPFQPHSHSYSHFCLATSDEQLPCVKQVFLPFSFSIQQPCDRQMGKGGLQNPHLGSVSPTGFIVASWEKSVPWPDMLRKQWTKRSWKVTMWQDLSEPYTLTVLCSCKGGIQ